MSDAAPSARIVPAPDAAQFFNARNVRAGGLAGLLVRDIPAHDAEQIEWHIASAVRELHGIKSSPGQRTGTSDFLRHTDITWFVPAPRGRLVSRSLAILETPKAVLSDLTWLGDARSRRTLS